MTTFADLRWRLVALLALAATPASAPSLAAEATTMGIGDRAYSVTPAAEWKLPGALRELSGFATDANGRLFAHNDEVAIVHELDYVTGRIVKSFAFGDPPLRGDFEGLTLMHDRFCLTDSNAVLICGNEGAADARMAFERIETGIGKSCEVEGVAYAADEDLLYFACKNPRIPALGNKITVIAWSPERRTQVPERTLSVDPEQFDDLPGDGAFRPSDVALTPAGRYLVLSTAKRRTLITLARDGSAAFAVRLPDSKPMKQIEALAFGAGGALLVGSEGGKDKGRMRAYHVAD